MRLWPLILVSVLVLGAVTASATFSVSGLVYDVVIDGHVEGGAAWVKASGRVVVNVSVEGEAEYVSLSPSIRLSYSEGLLSEEELRPLSLKLNSSEVFVVSDPVSGPLQPYLLMSIDDFPKALWRVVGCSPAQGVVSRNETVKAALTTFEGRDSLEYWGVANISYSGGSWASISTHSVIDLSTLEPLVLERNATLAAGNCSVRVSLAARLMNPSALPGSGVHEYRLLTGKGLAVVVIGGVEAVSGPVQAGEDRAVFTLNGSGRAAVVIAYPRGSSPPRIIIDGEEAEPTIYRFGAGTAYAVDFFRVSGSSSVEVVFGSGGLVALQTTTPLALLTPSPVTFAGESSPAGAGPLPYVIGAVIAGVVGLVTALILRRH